MLRKRLINAIVTIPVLVVTATMFLAMALFGWVGLCVFRTSAGDSWESTLVLLAGIVFIAMLGCAILILTWGLPDVLIEGNGILWRRVYENDTLIDKDGRVVHVFRKDELVWRTDPIFQKGKLKHCL